MSTYAKKNFLTRWRASFVAYMYKTWRIFVYSDFGTISLLRAYLRRCLRPLVKCSPVSSVYRLHWTSPLQPTDNVTRTYPVMLFGASRPHHTYSPHDTVWDQQISSYLRTPWCCLGSADYITRTYPMMLFGACKCPHTYLPRDAVRHQQKTRQMTGLAGKYDHDNQ